MAVLSFRCVLLSCASLLVLAGGVQAQDAAAPVTTSASALETVVVTARRVEENLKDVPMSASVVSGKDIERMGATSLADIGFSVPNVVIFDQSNSPVISNVSIRGLNNRTGIYVDDVAVGTNRGIDTMLLDVARVEVLRGPQGTLFGQNTIAGTINTVTRAPSSELAAEALLSAGEYGLRQFAGTVSGPLLDDKLGFVVSAAGRENNGIDTILGTGKHVNQMNGYALRGKLEARPTDALDVMFSATYTQDSPLSLYEHAYRDIGTCPAIAQCIDLAAGAGGPNNVYATTNPNVNSRNLLNLTLRASYDFGDGYTLTSITGYQNISSRFQRDNDFSPKDFSVTYVPEKFHSWSQELRLASPHDARFNWQAGVYYLHQTTSDAAINDFGADFVVMPFGATLAQLHGMLPGIFASIPFHLQTLSHDQLDSYAAFGQVNYAIFPDLIVTGGLRYTYEELAGDTVTTENYPLGYASPFTALSTSDNNLSPLASVSYHLNDDINLYATYSAGYKSGGFNLSAGSALTRQYKPENANNYEAGLKGTFFDNSVSVDLAGFYIDYQDLQRSLFQIIAGVPVTDTTNAAAASSTGVELQVAARPIENLDLSANLGYQDAHYDHYASAPVSDGIGGGAIVDLSGKQLAFAPKWTISASAAYRHPLLGWLDLISSADLQYRSSFFLSDSLLHTMVGGVDVTDVYHVQATTILNLSIGVAAPDDKWQFLIRGRNVTDDRYITNADFFGFTGLANYGTQYIQLSNPAMWSLELRLKT